MEEPLLFHLLCSEKSSSTGLQRLLCQLRGQCTYTMSFNTASEAINEVKKNVEFDYFYEPTILDKASTWSHIIARHGGTCL